MMRFKRFWRRLQDSLSRPRSLQRPAVFLEPLEERTVPTIMWSSAGSRIVKDFGGPVITHADVDLVFWGAGWTRAQAFKTQVINAVTTILNSTYLSGLSQYRGVGSAQLLRTDDIIGSSPASHSVHAQFDTLVRTSLNSGLLPVTPDMDSQILYMVIPQPGTTDPIEFYGGAHSSDASNSGRFHFGWVENVNNIDDITYVFSHELTESVTDPEQGYRPAFRVPSTGNDELCDGDAQLYSYRLDGVLVQSSLSQRDHGYVVYDDTTQKFILSSSRVLTVNGDQMSSADDTITIDQHGGGYRVLLNGEVAQFDAFDFFTGVLDVGAVVVNTHSGNDTVNIEKTISGVSVTVNLGAGNDTVNLSPTSQSLSGLIGAVIVRGSSGSGTLNLFDQGIRSSENYTVSNTTITRTGIPKLLYSKLTNVVLNTSNSTDTVTIQGVPAGTRMAVNGGSDSNTLTNQLADNIWMITGTNSGSISGDKLAGLVTFANVQNLVGGSNNSFVLSDAAAESGNIHSGTGTSLDYSAYTTEVSVNLQTDKATGVGGVFAGIQNFAGGGGMNTLVGANTANVWSLTGMNQGSVSGSTTVAFTSFQNLIGGTATNTFVFSDGAGISGNLDGGGGGSLDYSAYTAAVSVNLQTATATGVGGVFSSIQNVTGGSGVNTFVGTNSANVWNLTGVNQGSVTGSATVAFTSFQNLIGGTATNAFVFSDGAGISGNLDGGGGGSLDYSAYSSSVIVDLQTASATGIGGSLANIQNVTGGMGGGAGVFNILVGNGGNVLTGGSGRRNLLIAGSSASTLQGGGDDDILIGGTTAYDKDAVSLLALMTYWSTTSDDYPTRAGNLLAGNGVPLLDPATVTSNGGGNTLTGGSGLNLYYGSATDNSDFDPTSAAVFVQL